MQFELHYDPLALGTIQMRKVPCGVCGEEFWVSEVLEGPYACSKPCVEERMIVSADKEKLPLDTPGPV